MVVIASPGRRRVFELNRDAADGVILTQRVADPVFGHQDASEVGMVLELDAEHVVDLALEGFAARIEIEHRRHSRVVGRHLHPQPDAIAFGV